MLSPTQFAWKASSLHALSDELLFKHTLYVLVHRRLFNLLEIFEYIKSYIAYS